MYLLMGVRVELVLMLYVTFILAAPPGELKTKIIPTMMKIATCFISFPQNIFHICDTLLYGVASHNIIAYLTTEGMPFIAQ
jgi:hypothetical protein